MRGRIFGDEQPHSTNITMRLWIVYHTATYSDIPKFAGVFSSHEKALAVGKGLKDPFITIHTLDEEEK